MCVHYIIYDGHSIYSNYYPFFYIVCYSFILNIFSNPYSSYCFQNGKTALDYANRDEIKELIRNAIAARSAATATAAIAIAPAPQPSIAAWLPTPSPSSTKSRPRPASAEPSPKRLKTERGGGERVVPSDAS
jgi:hypothetical protein